MCAETCRSDDLMDELDSIVQRDECVRRLSLSSRDW